MVRITTRSLGFTALNTASNHFIISSIRPLEVIGHDGMAVNITMEPGDLVLYESHSIIHGVGVYCFGGIS
jgi:hypothetical protein